ncbi:hypothetical protein B0H10DRAFT_1791300, partial [Mycena sp. CBHHK59/15]
MAKRSTTQSKHGSKDTTRTAPNQRLRRRPCSSVPNPTGRLALQHLDELNALWPADPRIPSVSSRRAWALARSVTPRYVHEWWSRRRPVAKKLRMVIPDDAYELSVGTP